MTNCLTQARFLVKDSSVGLITAATDGYFTMWDLTNTLGPFYAISASQLKLKKSLQETEISPENIVCENRFQITSNSIKAMELVQISENVDLLLAGSDDNSVTVSLLRTSPTNGDRTAQVVTVSIPDAHTASVTALQVISHRKTRHTDTGAEVTSLTAVTSGNDHRIKTWSITIDPAQSGTKGVDIDLQSDRYSPVADISSLGILQNPTESRLLVGGVGLELLRLKFK